MTDWSPLFLASSPFHTFVTFVAAQVEKPDVNPIFRLLQPARFAQRSPLPPWRWETVVRRVPVHDIYATRRSPCCAFVLHFWPRYSAPAAAQQSSTSATFSEVSFKLIPLPSGTGMSIQSLLPVPCWDVPPSLQEMLGLTLCCWVVAVLPCRTSRSAWLFVSLGGSCHYSNRFSTWTLEEGTTCHAVACSRREVNDRESKDVLPPGCRLVRGVTSCSWYSLSGDGHAIWNGSRPCSSSRCNEPTRVVENYWIGNFLSEASKRLHLMCRTNSAWTIASWPI